MDKKILRIIDANINRITEGFRVVEEFLRFVYNDEKIYKKLRTLRHQIVKIFSEFYPDTVLERNSINDPGIKAKEKKYKNVKEIVVSNIHRVTESLRVLEEISKLISSRKVMEVKRLRYKMYDLEKYIIEEVL